MKYNLKLSSSVTPTPFQVLSSPVRRVATVMGSTDRCNISLITERSTGSSTIEPSLSVLLGKKAASAQVPTT